MSENVKITTPYITVGQLLKETTIASTGGMVKMILADEAVLVNGEEEDRRGRKLYPGDVVEVIDTATFIVEAAD